MKIIEVLKALAHENRIRILNLLAESELCVCELENIMQVTQSNASRHLSKLKQADLIKGRKRAQWIYYSLNQELLTEHKFLQYLIEEEIKDFALAEEDKSRLEKYNFSSLSCETLPDSDIFKD
jgi:ArsR family transcriptional regulator